MKLTLIELLFCFAIVADNILLLFLLKRINIYEKNFSTIKTALIKSEKRNISYAILFEKIGKTLYGLDFDDIDNETIEKSKLYDEILDDFVPNNIKDML